MSGSREPAHVRSGVESIRDVLLFVAGLALGGWTVAHPPIETLPLGVAVGLCVAPAALADRFSRREDDR